MSFLGCSSAEDPNYLWLMSLGNGGTTTVPDEEDTGGSFDLDVNDVQGNPDFIFETTSTINVHVVVQDPVAPVNGSLVQIREMNGSQTGIVLFQAATNSSGQVKGNFTINTTTNIVRLHIVYAGKSYDFDIKVTGLTEINRVLFLTAALEGVQDPDRDGDGIPDSEDTFPDDPSRALTVRYPGQGHYTIAWEDLFPNQGDADFNDYVIQAVFEEDLNASGEVVRIRKNIRHVARGAGYKHYLRLNLPEGLSGQLNVKTYNSLGELMDNTSEHRDNFRNWQIMERSNQTINSSNVRQGQIFESGQSRDFEIQLDTPVSKLALGAPPYDLYIHVINTGHEIHFAGRYFNEDGSDKYLDPNGFPWALMIPGNWRWMYERKNIHNAYEFFDDWYMSEGQNNTDWYNYPNESMVFPY